MAARPVLTHVRHAPFRIYAAQIERRSLFCFSPLLFWWPNLIAKIGVAPSHGGKFHERCNFTDRLFL